MNLIPHDAPTTAIGNLRFTAGGVYADYLVSGLPFIFLPKESQDWVADVHARPPRYSSPVTGAVSGVTVHLAPFITSATAR